MQQTTQGKKKVTGLSRNAARIELTPQAAALVQAARRILKLPKYQLELDIFLKDKNAVQVPVSGDLQMCLNEQMAAVEALKTNPDDRGLRLWLADWAMEELLIGSELPDSV